MNSLVIPPSPNWYETSILACAPDNTLIYGARNDIVVIEDSPNEEPANVRIICRAHSQKITSVNINKNWGQPSKVFVTVAEDKVVKLWNAESMTKVLGHNEHMVHNKVIGATFAGDERVISVSDDGVIIVWNTNVNQTNVLKDIFGSKVTVTCISTCPHASWLTAFGLKSGLVVICDLRKQGKVLYKLRGHDKSVMSLAWCPAPVNIFPKNPHNYVGMKKLVQHEAVQTSSIDVSSKAEDGAESKLTEVNGKQKRKYNKKNVWSNLKHADDDEIIENCKENDNVKVDDSDGDDFLKECDLLLKKITSLTVEGLNNDTKDTDTIESPGRVILKAKKSQQFCKGDKEEEPDVETCHMNSEVDLTIPETSGDLEKSTESVKLLKAIAGDVSLVCLDDILNNVDNEEESNESVREDHQVIVEAEVKGAVVEEEQKNSDEMRVEYHDVLKTTVNTNETTVKALDTGETTVMCADVVEMTGNVGETAVKGAEIDKSGETCTVDIETIILETTEVSNSNGSMVTEEENEENKLICKNSVIQSSSLEVRREIPRNITVEEEPRKEFLLASSAKEGNIYIWRAGTDGRMQTFFNLSSASNQRKSRRSNSDKLWITLCWVTPTVLLSSSKTAELIQWTLPKPKDNTKHFRLIHNDHSSILFSIAAPITILNEHNWLNETKTNAWTVGHDRLLLNTSLGTDRKNLACYPTLSKVECFASSPLDPTRLAVGTLEGIIKIWDMSRPHSKCIMMSSFYQKIQSKVVTLAWHPTNELLLAYGTLEGRIGYMDISNKSKMPTLLPNFFKTQIHNIEWGPINGDKDNLGLFAGAEGKLVIFNVKLSKQEPTEVDTPDNTYVYNFAWKPDYSILIVSTKAGAVIVYSTELKLIKTHYFQYKFQCIMWHPDATQNISKYRCCFAAICNYKEMIVFNFESDEKDGLVLAKYEGDGDAINSAAWSPHEPNKLVVASESIAAEVWDIESNTILSTFINPSFEGSSSVVWSPLDPNFVILASKDHTIRIWKISDYPKKDYTEISELRKKVIKEISNECSDLLPKVEKIAEESQKVKKSSRNNLLPNFYLPKDTTQTVNDLRQLLSWKESLSNGEVEKIDNKPDILKMFGSHADMLSIVDLNQTVHKEKGKYKLGHILSLFKGDINTTVKEAIDNEKVDPWIIMMAPLVSPILWKRACEIYAVQLSQESDSDPLEVATFYLACHKVPEAINALCEGRMYREALTLAKCRLLESDSTITDIIEKWAKYSLVVGNFEVSAQCNIFLGNYEQAASVLFRRTDVEILEFATELAQKSGNKELHEAVQFRYSAFKNANEGDRKDELLSKAEAVLLKEKLEDGTLHDEGSETREECKENGD